MTGELQQLESHRVALTGHCYRMLGSAVDAEDAVQESMVRAWRSIEGFDGRSSLRTWLYRIATNVCLDALSDRKRRERPTEERPQGSLDEVLEERPRTHWLEPIAEVRALPVDVDPAERLALRQSLRLAFVAAMQHLPPKQRAALLLTEVLGWSATEVADCLETSVSSINSALQRARATLATRDLGEPERVLSSSQSELVERYMNAFLAYDVDRLTSLLREDATLSMPPFTLWLQGPEIIHKWMLGPGVGCKGSRLFPVAASAAPAFCQYRLRPDGSGYFAWALLVLELSGDRISQLVSFLDVENLFPLFGMPLTLDAT
ncbi:MAG: sigma-70 family RNA polymerase sigma factor [Myxococcales bacterium]